MTLEGKFLLVATGFLLAACQRAAPGSLGEGRDGGHGQAGDGGLACGPGTCPGCCTAEGECLAGNQDQACGLEGAQCADCAALGGRCEAGVCRDLTRPCGPGTCSGCCTADGQCIAGGSDEACGRGGAVCADCTARGGVCREGSCCLDPDGDGYGEGCPLGPDCDDRAPGVTGPCDGHGCPQGWAYVPAGEFLMGCTTTSNVSCPDEYGDPILLPLHTEVTGAYCIQKTEVSVGAYRACEAAGVCPTLEADESSRFAAQCNWGDGPGRDRPDHPMNCLPYEAMLRFCQDWMGGDLPTEQEWEKAARGTDGRPYPWGSEPEPDPTKRSVCEMANLHYCGLPEDEIPPDCQGPDGPDEAPWTWEVGHLGGNWASPYGLADMLGNVFEQTRTLYREPGATLAPGEDGEVVRKGSSAEAGTCETIQIPREVYWRLPTTSSFAGVWWIGFRCVRRLPEESEAGP